MPLVTLAGEAIIMADHDHGTNTDPLFPICASDGHDGATGIT